MKWTAGTLLWRMNFCGMRMFHKFWRFLWRNRCSKIHGYDITQKMIYSQPKVHIIFSPWFIIWSRVLIPMEITYGGWKTVWNMIIPNRIKISYGNCLELCEIVSTKIGKTTNCMCTFFKFDFNDQQQIKINVQIFCASVEKRRREIWEIGGFVLK